MATVLGSISRVARGTGSRHLRSNSFHTSRPANAILMPALSPMMTEGTVSRWNKKEGEAFAAGDVLLHIEDGFNSLEIRAELPGVLGKILIPEGSTNVPVEHVIALVARDQEEFAHRRFFPAPPPVVRRARAPSPLRAGVGSRGISPSPSSPRTPTALRFLPHFTQESAGGSVASVRGMMMDHHRSSGDHREHSNNTSMRVAPSSPDMIINSNERMNCSRSEEHQDTRIFNGLMD